MPMGPRLAFLRPAAVSVAREPAAEELLSPVTAQLVKKGLAHLCQPDAPVVFLPTCGDHSDEMSDCYTRSTTASSDFSECDLHSEAETAQVSAFTVDQLSEAFDSPALRAQLGCRSLGKGAEAVIFTIGAETNRPVDLPGGDSVLAGEIAVKLGYWSSKEKFEREVQIQSFLAEQGIAPRVFFSKWLDDTPGRAASGPKRNGFIAMQRLTQPSYFKWLCWTTKEYRRSHADCSAEYVVDPAIAKLPLVKAWAKEVGNLKAQLIKLGVDHGDLHDQNIMFHVPSEAMDVFESSDPKASKQRLAEAIAKGPGGPARLMFIDFGQSKMRQTRAGKLYLTLCGGGERLADPDQEPLSPDTPGAAPFRRHQTR